MNKKMILTGTFIASALLAGCSSRQAPAATVAAPTAAAAVSTATIAAPAITQAATQPAVATASTATTSQDATPAIVAAANAFIGTLSDAEKKTMLFDWTDTAQKQRWSNFPPAGFKRAGLMWGNMSAAQQTAWLTVMQATLSSEGYNRVVAEWNADEALVALEGSGGGFGKANYFIAIIGTPSETTPWQWQWGGHHVTVNATIVGPNISLTPSFIGLEPAEYTDASGNKVRALGDIEDEAFALVNLLDATQQKAAILGEKR